MNKASPSKSSATNLSKRIESYTESNEFDSMDLRNEQQSIKQETWQRALSQAITNPKHLFERLQLDSSKLDDGVQFAAQHFKLFATESYLKRIELGNWNDPLLRQILPLGEELLSNPSYTLDPLKEQEANPIPGLLHKYQGRALLITNAHCAINCRFCFRKNFPYSENHYSSKNKAAVENYLRQNMDISEVILSGGDPLLLNDKSLEELINALSDIPHLKRLRIHSRIPIVLPERITTKLLTLLKQSRLKIIIVIHCNHAQEIDAEVSVALQQLKNICSSLLNQSVLLKGVNNDAQTLIELQHTLFENGVHSYYLHLLDKVKGTAHFDIPLIEAQAIYQSMAQSLPGYMLPKLVRESADYPHKVQVDAFSLFQSQ